MAKTDYYEVLGLDRNAISYDIKRAFRSLARKFHPDKNPDDPDSESKFKEVQEAYAILSNPDEKSKYDRYGHNRPGEPIWPRWLQGVDINIEDLFEEVSRVSSEVFSEDAVLGEVREVRTFYTDTPYHSKRPSRA